MEIFGKSIVPLLRHKKSYFEENDTILENSRTINRLYNIQPSRKTCKNCAGPRAPQGIEFLKQEVAYWFCVRCGHLNGAHEDSDAFCAQVYAGGGSENYAKNYATESPEAYRHRMQDIYIPKARFLIDALVEEGENPQMHTFTDFGAGSGYFAGALYELGMRAVLGYEPSSHQVEFGNRMLASPLLKCVPLAGFEQLAVETKSSVVSMIGVMEHLQRPREMFQGLAKNSAVQYVFILVPFFSPAVFFELAFSAVVQRVLGARHTHIYTQESLKWLCDEFGFTQCAAWWFGTDAADIYRDVFVTLRQQGHEEHLVGKWKEMFLPLIDEMQLVMDKHKVCSEGHLLLKKKSRG